MNCIQRIAQQGNRSLWNIDHFVSTAKSCINVVSTVKYSKKGNVKFLNQWAHESELRKIYLHFGDHHPHSCESEIRGSR